MRPKKRVDVRARAFPFFELSIPQKQLLEIIGERIGERMWRRFRLPLSQVRAELAEWRKR